MDIQRDKKIIFKEHEWGWSFYTRVLAVKNYIHSLCKLLSSISASQHLNCPIWKWKEQWCLATLWPLDIIQLQNVVNWSERQCSNYVLLSALPVMLFNISYPWLYQKHIQPRHLWTWAAFGRRLSLGSNAPPTQKLGAMIFPLRNEHCIMPFNTEHRNSGWL